MIRFNNKTLLSLCALVMSFGSTIAQTFPNMIPGIYVNNLKTITGFATKQSITLDGRFDEAVWVTDCGFSNGFFTTGVNSGAPQLTNWINISGGTGNQQNLDGRVSLSTDDEKITVGVAWDTTYLYIGYAGKSKRYTEVTADITNAEHFTAETFIAPDNSKRSWRKTGGTPDNTFSGTFDITGGTFPRVYGFGEIQFRTAYLTGKANRSLSADDGTILVDAGTGFATSDVEAYFRINPQGEFAVEIRARWAAINNQFIDPITQQYNASDVDKKPLAGRALGIEFGFSLPSTDATSRNAMVAWNQCCVNRSWTESIGHGTLVLTGSPVPLPLATFSIAGLNITDGQPKQLQVTVTPADASNAARFELITDPAKPVVKISPTGEVTPLNNGTATVIGYSLSSQFEPNAITTSSAIITVSNQPSVESLSVTGGTISTQWGTFSPTATSSPAGSNSEVIWSIVSNNSLAGINSITGLVTSRALGNGTVRIKAVSIADISKTAEADVNIDNQFVLSSSVITMTSFLAGNYIPCSNGVRAFSQNAITFTGYSVGLKLPLNTEYFTGCGRFKTVTPANLIRYSVRHPIGSNNTNSVRVIRSSGGSDLEFTGITGAVTLVGTYMNDTTVKVATRIVLRGSTPTTTCTSAPAGDTIACTNNVLVFHSGTGVQVYPNPANGDFSVAFEVSKPTNMSVSVFNAVGSVVASSKVPASGKAVVPVKAAGLPGGIYYVRVTTDTGESAVKKVIIE